MSNPESFIEEVTEEVRRDKLYAALRKYGWIGILAVILLVGGAAVNEWMKARDQATAEATGDAILAALEAQDLAALDAVPTKGDARVLVALTAAAEAATPQAAAEKLAALAGDTTVPQLYRDLATLKRATLPGGAVSAEDRITSLEPLALAGGPFRALAEEQIALAEIELGKPDAALSRLQTLMQDKDASGNLRRRATQLIVALGGDPNGEG
ncbi:MAG TPA: hypothetical protein ENK63_03570 [Rhodobacterales bacterium]|nr:hypothetical protein [Rhodobacterales bacterium]